MEASVGAKRGMLPVSIKLGPWRLHLGKTSVEQVGVPRWTAGGGRLPGRRPHCGPGQEACRSRGGTEEWREQQMAQPLAGQPSYPPRQPPSHSQCHTLQLATHCSISLLSCQNTTTPKSK